MTDVTGQTPNTMSLTIHLPRGLWREVAAELSHDEFRRRGRIGANGALEDYIAREYLIPALREEAGLPEADKLEITDSGEVVIPSAKAEAGES